MSYRILVTGSRDWQEWGVVEAALRREALAGISREYKPGSQLGVYVIHGDCPTGADAAADVLAPRMGLMVERYPGNDFPTYKDRNQHMVDLGADVCIAFAAKWASGTGQTARMARKAGIRTIDYGVDTE